MTIVVAMWPEIRPRRGPLICRGRQGVRLGVISRLGCQGAQVAGRARGARRRLRAHPPQQPGWYGCAAAAIRGGRPRLGLTGEEAYDVEGLADAVGGLGPGRRVTVRARRTDGSVCVFSR